MHGKQLDISSYKSRVNEKQMEKTKSVIDLYMTWILHGTDNMQKAL